MSEKEENHTDSLDNVNAGFLDARQAAEYLSRRWGIPYNAMALKKYRQRKGIRPSVVTGSASLWTKAELDQIEKPDRSRPRGKRKRDDEASEGASRQHKVPCNAGSLSSCLPELVA